jgi:hypothetical protein
MLGISYPYPSLALDIDYTPLSTPTASVHLAMVRQTVAIANSDTRNSNFLSTLISKAARTG